MRRLREERGASAVEFAIVASLLFMILFGTIQFGIIFNRYQGMQAGAREGARLGSLEGTSRQEIVSRVAQSLSIVNASAISAAPCPAGSPPTLSLDQGCVRVSRRSAPAAALVAHGTDGQPGPCNEIQPDTGGKSVIVEVFYRTRLDIPLWASPQLTISGSGEFRCE